MGFLKENYWQYAVDDVKACLEWLGYSYTDAAVSRIVTDWLGNKLPLIRLLRKHPDWVDRELAIVSKVEVPQKIDQSHYLPKAQAIIDMYIRQDLSSKLRNCVVGAILHTKVHAHEFIKKHVYELKRTPGVHLTPDGWPMSRCLEEYLDKPVTVEVVSTSNSTVDLFEIVDDGRRTGIMLSPFATTEWQPKQKINYDVLMLLRLYPKAYLTKDHLEIPLVNELNGHVGARMTRFFNKVFEHIGLPKLPGYEKLKAAFMDAITERSITEWARLSVHPCVFLTMSHGVSWTSCYSTDRTRPGVCRSASTSLMLDSSSMILYTTKTGIQDYKDIWETPKISRSVFSLCGNRVLNTRTYPASAAWKDEAEWRPEMRSNFARKSITACLGLPDSWAGPEMPETLDGIVSEQGKVLSGYDRPSVRVYTLPENDYYPSAMVGTYPRCLYCGDQYIYNVESMYCNHNTCPCDVHDFRKEERI